jgi:Ca2+ transporting ATPase
VRRNGQVISVDTKQIVVGDLLLFNIGDGFGVDGIMVEGS